MLDLRIAGAVPPLVCAWCRGTWLHKGHDMCVQNFGRELRSIDMLEGLGLDEKKHIKMWTKCSLASSGSGQRSWTLTWPAKRLLASGQYSNLLSVLSGVGIVLITVSGVAWRLTAHDAPSCRMMLGLGGGDEGGAEPNRRFVPRLPPSYGRPHHPYAGKSFRCPT
jgi:hypothetical protein